MVIDIMNKLKLFLGQDKAIGKIIMVIQCLLGDSPNSNSDLDRPLVSWTIHSCDRRATITKKTD